MKGCSYTPHVSAAALNEIGVTKQQQKAALAAKQAETAADKAPRKAEAAESNAQMVRAMIARGDSCHLTGPSPQKGLLSPRSRSCARMR
jgi:hypothetical protein